MVRSNDASSAHQLNVYFVLITFLLTARQVQEYRGRPQLLAAGGTAWLVIRKKQAVRETFQKVPIPGPTGGGSASAASGGGGGSSGGGVDDEDPDPDDDSPPSGPDAGGGEADAVLPSSEWEVQASSANYTMSEVDQDRCGSVRFATACVHSFVRSFVVWVFLFFYFIWPVGACVRSAVVFVLEGCAGPILFVDPTS